MALSHRQLAFVREYGKDFNGTQAAIRAGYSKAGASVAGTRLLRTASVRLALGPGLEAQKAEAHADIEKWKREVGKIAFANVDPDKLTHDHKLKGLDLYGRHLGAFQGEGAGVQQAFAINIHISKEE